MVRWQPPFQGFLVEREIKNSSPQLPCDLRQLVSMTFTDMSVVQPDYHQ